MQIEMLVRKVLTPARRIAGATLRGKFTSSLAVAAAVRTNPAILSKHLPPIISLRTYASGRPQPPGGTHRINLSGGEEKSALEQYGVDLTARARDGKLDPVIGRDAEIHRTIQVLSRRTKNNPVLIGNAGTGMLLHLTTFIFRSNC